MPTPWTPSEAVVTDGPNDLVVTVTGEQITASVNGEELVTLTDSTFAKGTIGFYTASSRTAANPHTRVRFDDVEVTVLQ